MRTLDRQEVQLVSTYLATAKLPRDLHSEILDHLCCDIEDKLDQGTPFEIAYQQVVNDWPLTGLHRLRRRTFFITKIQPMLTRIAILVLISGSLFAFWPQQAPIQVAASGEEVAKQDPKSFPTVEFTPPTGSPIAGIELKDSHSKFGMRIHPFSKKKHMHFGMDFKAKLGTPVLATAPGKVIFAGTNGPYGIQVKILHADGYVTSYAHLQDFQVELWGQVTQGQQIARVGNSGQSTGPHLHYELRKDDQAIDPLALLE